MRSVKSAKAGLIMLVIFTGLSLMSRDAAGRVCRTDPLQEEDRLVSQRLEWFQDQKLGLMMHWGPYSQWGIVESWSLCSEDEPWCTRHIDDYVEYRRQYEALKTTFNPQNFDPDRWAQAARAAGMRYVVFTAKHHDGFCMYDTQETDYKITDSDCAFHSHPRADVTQAIFEAFRGKGFGIGVYFSKPDWHSPDYWAPEWATPDRNVNYDTAKYPGRWQRFREFTFSQIRELMTNYGRVDILWLDGGWVRPRSSINDQVRAWCKSPYDQDIDVPRIAAMARGLQPGLIIVDRTVPGRFENYRTPEHRVPEKPLAGPWETCMPMGDSWSYVPDDRYKNVHTLIHLLVDIVAKGGNLLLNIGPSPQGDFAPEAYDRLRGLGDWLRVNGEAIYTTRPVAPFKEAKIRYTRSRSGAVYAIYLGEEDEPGPPAKVMLYSVRPLDSARIHLLGVSDELRWESVGKGVLIHVPGAAVQHPPCRHGWCFRISGVEIDPPARHPASRAPLG